MAPSITAILAGVLAALIGAAAGAAYVRFSARGRTWAAADPAPHPVRHRRRFPLPVATPTAAGAFGASVAAFVGALWLSAGGPDLGQQGTAGWIGVCTFAAAAFLGGRRDRTAELTAAAQAHREALAQAARHLDESPETDRRVLAAELRALPPPALLVAHEP